MESSARNLPNHNLQCDYFHRLHNCKTCNGRILTMFNPRAPIPKCDCTKDITDATIIQNARKRLILTRGGNDCCEYANESTNNHYPKLTQKMLKQTKTSKRLMGKKIRGGRYCLSRLNANNPLAKIMFEEPKPDPPIPPSKPAPASGKWHHPEDEIPGLQFKYATAQKNDAKPQILEKKLYQTADGPVLDLVIGDPVDQGIEQKGERKCTKQNSQIKKNEEVCEKYEQGKEPGKGKCAKRNRRTKKKSKNNLDGLDRNLLCKKLTDGQSEKVCEKIEEADKEEAQTYILKPQEERYISVRNIIDLQEPGLSQLTAEDIQVLTGDNKENVVFPNTQDDEKYIPILSPNDNKINIFAPCSTASVQDDKAKILSAYPSPYSSLNSSSYSSQNPSPYPFPYESSSVQNYEENISIKDNLTKIIDPTVSPIHCDYNKIADDLRRSRSRKPKKRVPYVPRSISEIIVEEYSCNHAVCKEMVQKHFAMLAQKVVPCGSPSN